MQQTGRQLIRSQISASFLWHQWFAHGHTTGIGVSSRWCGFGAGIISFMKLPMFSTRNAFQCLPPFPVGKKKTRSGFGVDLQVVGLQVGMSSYKDDTKISSGVHQCVNMSCCSSSVDCIYTYIQHKSVYMNLYVYCNVLKNLRNRTWKTQQFVSFDNQSTSERVANPCSSETSAM